MVERWQFQLAVLVENFVVEHVGLDVHLEEVGAFLEEAVDAFLAEVEIVEDLLAFAFEEVGLHLGIVVVEHRVEVFETAVAHLAFEVGLA